MKAIIVGGGIVGLSTAWALAKSGHDVELFEQWPLPNPLASSMDEHRLIRHPYGDRTGYARLIDEAVARPLRRPTARLRPVANRPAEGLLLHRDRRRTFRGLEAG